MKRETYKVLTTLALRLHSLSYKLSTQFAIKAEGGLHPKHRLMNYHKFFVDNVNPNDIVLDIGCGNGPLTRDLAKKAKRVVGIDLNAENIRMAEEKYLAPNIEYLVGNAIDYEFNQRFDVVILSSVLEHIEDRGDFLNKTKNLAPKILIRVPTMDRDWITLYKKEIGLEYRLDKTHFIEYTLESFKGELQKAGLKIDRFSIQFGEIWSVVKQKF